MGAAKFTPGPWGFRADGERTFIPLRAHHCERLGISVGFVSWDDEGEPQANARLIAAAPTQHAEMLRYLPVLERLEADPEAWERFTTGTGIATLNGYRAAIAAAKGEA